MKIGMILPLAEDESGSAPSWERLKAAVLPRLRVVRALTTERPEGGKLVYRESEAVLRIQRVCHQ